jgi:hypothetical protein
LWRFRAADAPAAFDCGTLCSNAKVLASLFEFDLWRPVSSCGGRALDRAANISSDLVASAHALDYFQSFPSFCT